MALIPRAAYGGGKQKFPTGITVTSPPKTTYTAGQALDLTGIVVMATYSDNTTEDITDQCTFTPAAGTVLYEQTTKIDIAWTWEDVVHYQASQPVTVSRVLQSIAITTPPTKTTYDKNETLNLAGMVVTATYTSKATEVVTGYTSSPAAGTVLSALGSQPVTISYSEGGVTKTASFTVSVNVKIVTWAGGTDQEIADMIAAADAGLINLQDYWAVGQERRVNLSAMAATGVGEAHVAQAVTMVLMNAGGKTLATPTPGGRTECNYIVGLKNGLANGTTGEFGYMNSTNTNTGGWKNSARRTWCNSVFKNAIPAALRSIFKPFINKSGIGNGSTSGTEDTTDTFALPAEVEVFGTTPYSVPGEGSQFQWYRTSANRIKKCGDSGSANLWWERSPCSGVTTTFCYVKSDGAAYGNHASITRLVAPFGCI